MRFFVDVNANPRALQRDMNNSLEVTSASVTRGDAALIELGFYTGAQGAATAYQLAPAFEMRFACKAPGTRPSRIPAVLAEQFSFLPIEQVYSASPSFNTIQLDSLFLQATGYQIKTGNYTLLAGDKGMLLAVESASATTITIPDVLALNEFAYVESAGTGEVTVAPGSGVTLTALTNEHGTASLTLSTRRGLKIIKTGVNTYTAEIPDELNEVSLECEFSWRETSPLTGWTSTKIMPITVINDLIRGDEGAPSDASAPTIYVTKTEIESGFVKTNVAQSLSDDDKARARGNIGAIGAGEVVGVIEQTFTDEQKGFARANIDAASVAALATVSGSVALKADGGALTALASVVGGKADQSAVNALDTRLDAVESTLSTTSIPRPTTLWMPTGSGTAIHLVGALHTASGTAKTRTPALYDAGSTITMEVLNTDFKHATGYVLANDQAVMLSSTTSVPGAFDTWTTYYVRNYNAGTRVFQLSLTVGGVVISRSSNGSGTIKVHKTYAASAVLPRARRIGFQSAATAGSAAGTRHHSMQWRLANDPTMGRWKYRARFGIADPAAVANARLFVGLVNRSTGLPNGNPSALLNLIGIGADTGDTNLYLIHNDGSGTATKYDLGTDYPVTTRNEDIYELQLQANDAGTAVAWRVRREATGVLAQGTVSSDLPAPLALLAPHIWRNNGSTALAVAIDALWWSIDSGV